jgi:hypothetical protein
MAQRPTATPAIVSNAIAAAPHVKPLIGNVGSEYVLKAINQVGPKVAIEDLKSNHGLKGQLCAPLLVMLDQLGVARREAHLYVLNKAKELLLSWVRSLPKKEDELKRIAENPGDPEAKAALQLQHEIQGKLERLLVASFDYLGIPELAEVSGRRCFAFDGGVQGRLGNAHEVRCCKCVCWQA